MNELKTEPPMPTTEPMVTTESMCQFYTDARDGTGLFTRKDGSRYAVILVGVPDDKINAQPYLGFQKQYHRLNAGIDFIVSNFVGTNRTLYLMSDGAVARETLKESGFNLSSGGFCAVFSNFKRVYSEKNKRYEIKCDWKSPLSNSDLTELLKNKIINPIFYTSLKDGTGSTDVLNLPGFFLEEKETDVNNLAVNQPIK